MTSAAIIVIAAGGFNLYHHYCACSEVKSNVTILHEDDCRSNSELLSCCTEEIKTVPSCCSDKKSELTSTNTKCNSTNNCCSSEHIFLKTDDFDYQAQSTKSFDFIISYVALLFLKNLENNADISLEVTYTNGLPPPKYGKQLLFSIQQLKLSSFMA